MKNKRKNRNNSHQSHYPHYPKQQHYQAIEVVRYQQKTQDRQQDDRKDEQQNIQQITGENNMNGMNDDNTDRNEQVGSGSNAQNIESNDPTNPTDITTRLNNLAKVLGINIGRVHAIRDKAIEYLGTGVEPSDETITAIHQVVVNDGLDLDKACVVLGLQDVNARAVKATQTTSASNGTRSTSQGKPDENDEEDRDGDNIDEDNDSDSDDEDLYTDRELSDGDFEDSDDSDGDYEDSEDSENTFSLMQAKQASSNLALFQQSFKSGVETGATVRAIQNVGIAAGYADSSQASKEVRMMVAKSDEGLANVLGISPKNFLKKTLKSAVPNTNKLNRLAASTGSTSTTEQKRLAGSSEKKS